MSSFEQNSGSTLAAPQSATSVTQRQTVTTNNSNYRLPCDATLQNVTKLSIVEDKPVMFDYWTDSLDKKALIGVREGSGEKLLVKSAEEYTSPIVKFYKSLTEYIVITENSIYVVASDIPTRKIS
jgi:hypothetical protein